MQKCEEYIAYGIGNYYQAVKQEVGSIIDLIIYVIKSLIMY